MELTQNDKQFSRLKSDMKELSIMISDNLSNEAPLGASARASSPKLRALDELRLQCTGNVQTRECRSGKRRATAHNDQALSNGPEEFTFVSSCHKHASACVLQFFGRPVPPARPASPAIINMCDEMQKVPSV